MLAELKEADFEAWDKSINSIKDVRKKMRESLESLLPITRGKPREFFSDGLIEILKALE